MAAAWRDVLESTLSWLEREVQRFLFGPDPDPARRRARIKPLAELALACDVGLAALVASDGAWRRLRELLARVRADVDDGRALAELAGGAPALAAYEASGLRTLADVLTRRGGLSGWPQAAADHDAAGALPAWIATLDLLAEGRRLGFDAAGNAAAAPIPADDAYVLAHVVLFRCDFGRGPPGALAGGERAWLRAWLPVWQRQVAADIDLVCELAMVARCAGVRGDGVDVPAAIRRAQEADGAVVGLRAVDLDAAAGPDAACPWFTRRYHATLVANMAASMSIATAAPIAIALQRPRM